MNKKVEIESEIEWETGVTEEGILIDVENSTQNGIQHHVDTSSDGNNVKDSSTFVIAHAPDGPNGDDEPTNVCQPSLQVITSETEGNDDEFFPVLSSKNRETERVCPPTQGEYNTSNVIVTKRESEEEPEGDSDVGEDDDEGVEAVETKEDNLPEVGILIVLDEEAKISTTVDSRGTVISDDENSENDRPMANAILNLKDSIFETSNNLTGIAFPRKPPQEVCLIDL